MSENGDVVSSLHRMAIGEQSGQITRSVPIQGTKDKRQDINDEGRLQVKLRLALKIIWDELVCAA